MFAMLLRWSITALVAGVFAIPSPQTLNSSITLLIDNDLQGAAGSASNSGVLLLEAFSLNDASEACETAGEKLWSPELDTSNVQNMLNYLNYSSFKTGFSQFWIASKNGSTLAIDKDGRVFQTRLDARLPVVCTQSAPFSNATLQDTSERWRITLESNNEILTGFRDRFSFRFLGIRYAPQPERFTYSEPYVGSGNEASALDYGSQCVQAGNVGDEDCLFLNIWTAYIPGPNSTAETLKPVMFWIHGGAFTGGTGNDPTFDGGNLASRGDVVVVSINYRLSTLGFLALEDNVTNGNFGLADQINALDWVRNHIKDFGGDPDRITIFGQSAGAGSVRALIASPKSIGKFAGAIPLSNLGGINYGTTYSKYYTIDEEMEVVGNAILQETGCTNAISQVDCLRAISPYELANLNTIARYPVVDGTYLTSNELKLDGPTLPVHIMMGTTRDDGAPFISYPTTTNQSAYLASQGLPVPPTALFPIPNITNQTLALFEMATRLATDGIFRCIDQATVFAGLRNKRFPPIYYYEFNRTYQTRGWPNLDVCEPPKTATHPHGDPGAEYLKCHSGELYFVFGNLARQSLPLRDASDLPFAQFVVDTFSAFARTFDPNPDPEFLAARGYKTTLAEIERVGRWEASTFEGGMTMRTLQWPGFQGAFVEGRQCEGLGLGLGYYLQ
ncbi:alpha/beta-hydrolase [Annulohypoxylon maeteangense]|uniref:alpha/beta-hydrolase n=1 Tax=Annulohypoxylon maeteangense TaxID=1927788 RepID=UPI0020085113|nr:alpha/beta-hydrolase [Annulohypoxylon maeteangense]KAI0887181.1 alpha/beta-hydrolase [Annulohypoxylon maeteangense]